MKLCFLFMRLFSDRFFERIFDDRFFNGLFAAVKEMSLLFSRFAVVFTAAYVLTVLAVGSFFVLRSQSGRGGAPEREERDGMIPVFKQNVGQGVLFSFLTFGGYYVYWKYLLLKNVRAVQKNSASCAGEMACLMLVPFYGYYWWFTRGQLVKQAFEKHGYAANGNASEYLFLGFFGLGVIAAAIMQNDFNALPTAEVQEPDPAVRRGAVFASFAGVLMVASGLLGGFYIAEEEPWWFESHGVILSCLLILMNGLIAVSLFLKNKKALQVSVPVTVVWLAVISIWAMKSDDRWYVYESSLTLCVEFAAFLVPLFFSSIKKAKAVGFTLLLPVIAAVIMTVLEGMYIIVSAPAALALLFAGLWLRISMGSPSSGASSSGKLRRALFEKVRERLEEE